MGKANFSHSASQLFFLLFLLLLLLLLSACFFVALFLASCLSQDLCQKLNIINSFKNNNIGVWQILICLDCNQWLHTMGSTVTTQDPRFLDLSLGTSSFWRFSYKVFRLIPSFCANSVSVIRS